MLSNLFYYGQEYRADKAMLEGITNEMTIPDLDLPVDSVWLRILFTKRHPPLHSTHGGSLVKPSVSHIGVNIMCYVYTYGLTSACLGNKWALS